MLELLFLLLPIAAAYGWYMGRRSIRIDNQQSSDRLSRNYVAGINFLLSEQPDKAVDLFIELLQVDDETLETHLALGNLFRQRGEVDRAIRIHQNLIARPAISYEQRLLAMLELARDFVAAGLLDRAESILVDLRKDKEYEEAAASMLIDIYQQMREWHKAIAVAEQSRKQLGEKIIPALANYYCELAVQDGSVPKKAISWLKKALATDTHCVRATLALARYYHDEGNVPAAMALLRKVADQDPDMASEALPLLKECYQKSDRGEYAEVLQYIHDKTTSAAVTLELATLIERSSGHDLAEQFILKSLKRHPTMRAFHRLMDYRLNEVETPQARESIGLLKMLVEEQIKVKPNYRCHGCGFSTRVIFWQCPSCRQWGSIKPIRGLDGD